MRVTLLASIPATRVGSYLQREKKGRLTFYPMKLVDDCPMWIYARIRGLYGEIEKSLLAMIEAQFICRNIIPKVTLHQFHFHISVGNRTHHITSINFDQLRYNENRRSPSSSSIAVAAPVCLPPASPDIPLPALLFLSESLSAMDSEDNEPSLADIPFEQIQMLRSDGTGVHKKEKKKDLARDNKNM